MYYIAAIHNEVNHVTKITTAMTAAEYAEYVSKGKARSLRAYTEGKSHSLPPPYNRAVPGQVEAEILRSVKFALANHGVWYMRMEGGGKIIGNRLIASSMSGMSDIIALDAQGRLCAIEIKRPGGRLSALQAATLTAIIRHGGRAVVCCRAESLVRWIKTDEGAVGFAAGIPVI